MRTALLTAACASLLLASSHQSVQAAEPAARPAARPAASEVSRAELHDTVRLVLDQHCGRCHNRANETAVPRALAIFDLAERNWFLSLTDAQLDSAKGRIDDPKKQEVTANDRALVARFVQVERERRSQAGAIPQNLRIELGDAAR